MKAYRSLIRIDLKLALRNRSVLFFNYLFPVLFFLIFAPFMGRAMGGGIPYVVSMVLILGILGNGLFGAGVRAAQEREANILRRFKVTPISPTPLLVASMVTGWVVFIPTMVIVLGMAHFLYGMQLPERWLSLFGMISLGVVAFRAIGLIVASVANSMQESNILVQILYMPMLFLSGATFPITLLPGWARVVAQFLPASYLVTGFQGVFYRKETLLENISAVAAMVATTVLATFVSTQLFRWEKEEKIRASAKLWIMGVLLPFFVLGGYQVWSQEQLDKADTLWHELQHRETLLIRGARVFVGDGRLLDSAAVLIDKGRIAGVFVSEWPEPSRWNAETIDAAGKTLLPGLVDLGVFVGAMGGAGGKRAPGEAMEQVASRALAAQLYCGVTALRSSGEELDPALELRRRVASGKLRGAEPFLSGPALVLRGSARPPELIERRVLGQSLWSPTSAGEARRLVDKLAASGADAVQVLMALSQEGQSDALEILEAAGEQARLRGLPLIVETRSRREVQGALEGARARVIEGGSITDLLPQELFEKMAKGEIFYAPTLARLEAELAWRQGDPAPTRTALAQQVGPPPLLDALRRALPERPAPSPEELEQLQTHLALARANLLRAHEAGAPLVAASHAGSPLVFHGPGLHRELQLWVEAGVPPAVALQAATYNAARALGLEQRRGLVREGYEANLLLVDGDPLADIANLERISLVIYRGARVDRAGLLPRP